LLKLDPSLEMQYLDHLPDGYNVVPVCRNYHPASELSKMAGYYPNISAEQLSAASLVLETLKAENVNFDTDGEDVFLKIVRFLRARKYNVKNALMMIREDVSWRSQNNRLNLSKESAYDVLDCDIEKIYNYFPVWFQGFDKQMRPVSYRQFGKFEIWNVLKLTSMERLIRFHAWETEQALRSMYSLSKSSGYNIETFVLVVDAAGWNMKLATSDAFTFIKGMAVTDSDHYPERLGTMFIINAPSMLSFAWRIIQGFLDSVTKDKIKILSSNPDEWQPVLQHYIDLDQIPVQYGGTAPNLTPEEAISAMNPPKGEGNDSVSCAKNACPSTPSMLAGTAANTPSSSNRGNSSRRESLKSVSFSPIPSGDNAERPAARRGGAVNCGTQTDEGTLVMAREVDHLQQAGCTVM